MKSRKEIREAAKLDVSLRDIPQRNSNGEYIASAGQKAILSEHLEMRQVDSEIELLSEERYRYLEEMVQIGETNSTPIENNPSEIQRLKKRVSELEEEIELKRKESDSVRNSFEKRGAIVPSLTTRETGTKETKKKPIKWGKIMKQVIFFLVIEGFLILIQFGSLRDHLSLLEVVYRSISVLAIAILIVHVHKTGKDNPNKMNIVFIIFCICMFIVSIMLPPFLYEDFTAVSSSISADPFDLNSIDTQGSVAESSWLIEKYLENTWIPAFLCVVFFLYLSYAHSLFKKKNKTFSDLKHQKEDEFGQLRSIHGRINDLIDERNELEAEIIQVSKKPTDLSYILGYLENLMEASQECEKRLKQVKIKFKDMKSKLEEELHSYQVEFLDFMKDENQLVQEGIPSPEWIKSPDIINYFKTYSS